MKPEPGALIFGLTRELFKVNLLSEKAIRGGVRHRWYLSRAERPEQYLHNIAISLFGGYALLLDLLQPLLINPSLSQHPLLICTPLLLCFFQHCSITAVGSCFCGSHPSVSLPSKHGKLTATSVGCTVTKRAELLS